jgi:hypothetical protein
MLAKEAGRLLICRRPELRHEYTKAESGEHTKHGAPNRTATNDGQDKPKDDADRDCNVKHDLKISIVATWPLPDQDHMKTQPSPEAGYCKADHKNTDRQR